MRAAVAAGGCAAALAAAAAPRPARPCACRLLLPHPTPTTRPPTHSPHTHTTHPHPHPTPNTDAPHQYCPTCATHSSPLTCRVRMCWLAMMPEGGRRTCIRTQPSPDAAASAFNTSWATTAADTSPPYLATQCTQHPLRHVLAGLLLWALSHHIQWAEGILRQENPPPRKRLSGDMGVCAWGCLGCESCDVGCVSCSDVWRPKQTSRGPSTPRAYSPPHPTPHPMPPTGHLQDAGVPTGGEVVALCGSPGC